MKLFALTLSYLKKNILYLLLAALPVAVFMSFFFRPFTEVTFLGVYSTMGQFKMRGIFRAILDNGFVLIYPIVIALVLLCLSVSLNLSIVERHFKTGRVKLSSPIKYINNSIFPVIINMIILLVVVLLWRFLTFGAVSLINIFFDSAHISVVNFVIAAVIALALMLVFFLILCPLILLAPVMIVYGYSFVDAWTMVLRLASKGLGSLFIGIMLPSALTILVQFLLFYLSVPYFVLVIVNTICFVFITIYIPVFALAAVFELSGMERRDNKKMY